MAKTITIEFTDAQWELIKEHYPQQYYVEPDNDLSQRSEWTEALVSKWLKYMIQVDVNAQIQVKAARTDSFDV